MVNIPDDPFLDPSVQAIHRIRGRGHENKKMLGPVKGCAVMISPWWHVHETLHVCEGVETALALYGEGFGKSPRRSGASEQSPPNFGADGEGAKVDRRTSADHDPDAWQFDNGVEFPSPGKSIGCHRPVWALGSAGAIATFPVIHRVRKLVVWADNDPSGTGLAAARECARRWTAAGKRVDIRRPRQEGADYAD
jgi:Toprim domain